MPELNWQGKYDDNGQIVGPPRVSLPFQTVETVNQSAQERQMALAADSAGRHPEWRNRLIWGDKKYVLPSLLDEFAGQVDLIYIDPPFATGTDFGYRTEIPPHNDEKSSLKLDYQPNLIEQIAYRDTWGGGPDTYLGWMYETLTLLRELLSESGSIYVHCDPSLSHYIKAVLDIVFGASMYRNELVWHYGKMSNPRENFPRNHDTIFRCTKSDSFTFNLIKGDDSEYKARYQRFLNGNQVLYGPVKNSTDKLVIGRAQKLAKELNRPLKDDDVLFDFDVEFKVQTDVLYVPIIKGNSAERTNYPTQKPEALLDRIIRASSNEGDLVLDCFVGSGTTAVIAEKLGRRWIAADMGRFAISTTRKRLLGIPNVKPFYVQNLGHYERQQWQSAETEQNYREFILQLYRAEPVSGYQWLHGAKAGRMVHIGAVDAPVAIDDVRRIVDEFGGVIGSGAGAPTTAGVDILGWDFGLEVDTAARELADRAGVGIRLLRIPREVMDAKAVDAGDIHFFELAALTVDCKVNRRRHGVALSLQDFTMPLDGVPSQVKDAVRHWSQWIDYWAVDWDYQNDTFNNQWQSYRTRQDPQLQRAITHTYESRGRHTVVVKVIDILGNDTTRRLEVSV